MTAQGPRSVDKPVPSIIADRYRVEREIGRGGMATVYLCTDSRDQSQVAIKVLRPELGSAVVVERFLREIDFASGLEHPQIPKVLDSGVIGDLPFYVMTFIEGESLRSRLDRVKQLTIDEAIRITGEVVKPTAYAHRLGIVHRDIKPGNILLAGDSVYVLDFGVARAILASADDRLTSTGVAVGTPAYMSPEQALADRDLDARSDIYSLACVTYEMIAGIPPFVGATAQSVMARRFVAAPPPLRETRESVPEAVEKAVAKALCKAPADRWQTVSEFGDALTALPQSSTAQAQQIAFDRKRRRYVSLVAAAIALVVIAVAGWSIVDRDPVERGRNALEAWDIGGAEAQFRAAVGKNANAPAAQLWLAQLLILKQQPLSEWAPFALKAVDRKADLDPVDRIRADALAAYADRERADRCGALRTLSASRDRLHPDDFSSTITLADCLASDPTVVRDPARRSGYRFASSYEEAVQLYESVLARNSKNGAAYHLLMPRLQKVLWTAKNRLRGGVLRGEVRTNFVASPTLVSDTISFEPFLLAGNSAPVSADAGGLNRLVARNLEKLRGFATAWTRATPTDPDAQESLASVLESTGKIDGSGATALASIRAARNAASSFRENDGSVYFRRIRLANTNARLLLKLGRFRDARILADSALSWKAPSSADDSSVRNSDALRSGLLALTGRQQSLIDFEQKYAADYPVRLQSGETRKLPADLASDVLRLAGYAAFGAASDSIVAIDARIRENIESVVSASEAADFRVAVLRRPLSLSLDAIGTSALASLGPSPDPFIGAVRAVDSGNLRLARQLADSLAAFRAGSAPGEVTMDVVLQEAWLRVAIGDSAAAARSLDRALRGLSHAPTNLLEGGELPAALVRAMVMRSRLAAGSGDALVRERWLGAARELWSRGDRQLVSMLQRLSVSQSL